MLQISGNNTQNPYFSHSFSLLLSISCLVFPPSQPLMSLTSWRRAQGGGYGDGRLVLVILLGGNNSMCLLSICRNCQEHNKGGNGHCWSADFFAPQCLPGDLFQVLPLLCLSSQPCEGGQGFGSADSAALFSF